MEKIDRFKLFIKNSIKKFGDKYDFSKANYVNNHTKIDIICPKHGHFSSEPNNFLHGVGCQKCHLEKNFLKFVEKANKKFNNKYDYSNAIYVNAHTPIKITCPIHGEFWQTPDTHLNSKGCQQCKDDYRKEKVMNSDEFISEAKRIHKGKYDYSLVDYNDEKTKVKVICPFHGIFEISPNSHLNGRGCKKCHNKEKMTNETFIEKAKQIHGDKYDYSNVVYKNNKTKIKIRCPIHGEFEMTPHNHLSGQICPKCSINHPYTEEEFIKKASIVHNGKYNYSNTKYVGIYNMINIKCPIHGDFTQNASSHINGCGCPKCNNSRLENKVMTILNKNNIEFEEQKRFDWLGMKSLDFYLPKYGIAIECQGEQHFQPIEFFGGTKKFSEITKRDILKYKQCKDNKIKLIYFSDKKYSKKHNAISNEETLINTIKKHDNNNR